MSWIFISYLTRGLSDLKDLLRRLRPRQDLFAVRAGDWQPSVVQVGITSPDSRRLKALFIAGAGTLVALAGLYFLLRPVPAGAAQAAARTGKTKISKDGLTYVWIQPGTFTMGCSPGDSECPPNEKPAHEVRITAGFWMGQTDVTQLAWRLVKGTAPSSFKGAQLPVETVNWSEAQSYCQALGMRLPTEAEWEYAARAGTTGSRYGDVSQIAWFSANSGGKTHEVMQKQPNAWGLYDMLGNVWQWTADWYADKYSRNAETDPHGPANGRYRAMRGGSWYFDPAYVRASFRSWLVPEFRLYDIGFRCAGN